MSASNWALEDFSSTGEEKYSLSGFLENRRTWIDVTTNCCFAGAIQEGRITCIDITKNAVSKTIQEGQSTSISIDRILVSHKRAVLLKGLVPFAIKRNFHSSRHFYGVIFHSGTL